jgi:hypothetical protein
LNISLLKPDAIEYRLPIILLQFPEIITFPTEHCLAIDESVIILLLIPARITELAICCRPLKVFDIIIPAKIEEYLIVVAVFKGDHKVELVDR